MRSGKNAGMTGEGLSDDLLGVVHGLDRALVRATRATRRLPALPESQVAVLRRLSATGGCTPARLAEDLHLARPTISNLVRDLTAAGLVERQPAPGDGRSVLLVPTDRARDLLSAFREGRAEVMAGALAGLADEDRAELAAALPALSRLLDRVRAEEGARR
jgi:DNA-binding MarR family transcriptional regulator